jgi:hypothetical protein
MDFKVYVLVEIPILEKECELFVPVDRRIHDMLSIIIKNIPELSTGYYKTNKPNVYSKTTGKVYNMNDIIKNTDIKMGTRLLVI